MVRGVARGAAAAAGDAGEPEHAGVASPRGILGPAPDGPPPAGPRRAVARPRRPGRGRAPTPDRVPAGAAAAGPGEPRPIFYRADERAGGPARRGGLAPPGEAAAGRAA